MSNPLINKKYYILLTPVITDTTLVYTYNKSGTTVNSNSSTITTVTSYSQSVNTVYYDEIVSFNTSGKTFQGITGTYTTESSNGNPIQYNVYDLSKYISNRLLSFISQLQQVNKCNSYSSNDNVIPSDCANTFVGYDSKTDISGQIAEQKTKLPLYKSSLMGLTDKKKHLQQQLNDVDNLIKTYKNILDGIKTNSSIPSSQYDILIKQQQQNVTLRADLDLKLGEIFEYDDSKIVKSKLHLDTTVYTGVLWSILATSLAYFVFVKL
jgi:hypothetical protein